MTSKTRKIMLQWDSVMDGKNIPKGETSPKHLLERYLIDINEELYRTITIQA
jgi:hypothetical protein